MHRTGSVTDNKAELLLNTSEASQLLYVHPNTLRRWSDDGIIKTYRIGPRADRRFRRDDIERFLAQLGKNEGNPHKCSL
jgi:excisionase family DNA binding protein